MEMFREIYPNLQLMNIQTEGPGTPETIWKFSLQIYNPLNMSLKQNMLGGILSFHNAKVTLTCLVT